MQISEKIIIRPLPRLYFMLYEFFYNSLIFIGTGQGTREMFCWLTSKEFHIPPIRTIINYFNQWQIGLNYVASCTTAFIMYQNFAQCN